jgi:hypothetical protein
MNLRRTKQFIYGALYAIIWFGICAAVYARYLSPAPSCFDNIQNQGELGVDCGGPCATVCIPKDIHAISPLGAPSIFFSSPGHYTLLAEVANTNPGFAARSFDYHFDLYDASGNIFASIPGKSFAYSGEVKYLIAPNLAIATSVDHTALVVSNPDWVAAAALGLVPQFKNPLPVMGNLFSSSTITVKGRLVNGDISVFTNILIIGIFRGANGNPLGASQTIIDRLGPNETQDFSVMYPSGQAIDPLQTQFYAYALRP